MMNNEPTYSFFNKTLFYIYLSIRRLILKKRLVINHRCVYLIIVFIVMLTLISKRDIIYKK